MAPGLGRDAATFALGIVDAVTLLESSVRDRGRGGPLVRPGGSCRALTCARRGLATGGLVVAAAAGRKHQENDGCASTEVRSEHQY